MNEKELEEIMKANAGIDPTLLIDGLTVIEQLKRAGLVSELGFKIQSPFARPLKQVPVTWNPTAAPIRRSR